MKQVPIQKLSSPHCDEMEGREIRRSRRGASALKSGQGPPGRGIAEGVSLLSEGERGRAPCRRPTPPPRVIKISCVLQCILLFPFFALFRLLWLRMGQHGPTYALRWANIAPTWANMAPRWANIAPRWANIAPRWANIAPRWANIAPKMGQHSPKMGQHSPKIGPHSSKIGRQPSKYPAFYSSFLLFPFFGSFGSTRVNMGQHRPSRSADIGLKIGPHSLQDRPT